MEHFNVFEILKQVQNDKSPANHLQIRANY
jgi:hypothetical protein